MIMFESLLFLEVVVGYYFLSLSSSQHPVPDRYLMRGSVEEVVRRFRAQMDHVPILSLYDRDKGVALNVPKELFRQTDTLLNMVYDY